MITDLVTAGVTDVKEMSRHLSQHVTRIFRDMGKKLPLKSDKRFFPNDATICNHMQKFMRKMRHSMVDQECLARKIEEWRETIPDLNLFFRPKGETDDNTVGNGTVRSDSDNLLFVSQEKWQRRLLNLYGTDLLLLDATYRTTRYALPLFFLVVKTNVDYQVVAVIVCESETTEAITEALSVIREWNPDFHPKFAMTDYCREEIAAIEAVFPGIFQLSTSNYPI